MCIRDSGYTALKQNTTIYSYSFVEYLLKEPEISSLYCIRYKYLTNFLSVFGLPEIKEKLQTLVLGGHIILNLSVRSIVPLYIQALRNMITFQNVSVEQRNFFFYFLHEHGYLLSLIHI